MKFNRFGAMTALIAGAAFVGCSGAQDGQEGGGHSSVGFNLRTPEGVVITTVAYDLNTAAGGDVLTGTIPVPNDNSVINGSINALSVGSYSLVLTAEGAFNGQPVNCTAAPAPFTLAANQNLALPSINLVCTLVTEVGRDSGNVSFTVGVTVEQVQIVRDVLETFVVAPTSTIAQVADSTCVFPPMAINVVNTNPAISYSWTASPDGAFALNATNTQGSYTCASNGTKTLTVTAALGATTGTRDVQVTCSGCDIVPPNPCGNGVVDPGEQCDESTPRCTACQITPVCGDGIVDAPEACDAGPTPSDTCSATCEVIVTPDDECGECIDANPDLGPLQAELCDSDPLCTAVQECVLANDCFLPIAATCYCGPDIDNCESPTFVPTGPCAQVIRAAAGSDNPSNAVLLERYFAFEFPLGVGMSILDEASRACTNACFAP